MAEIKCQNCGEKLAEQVGNSLRFDPNGVGMLTQEITADKTLITLQCPKCGCILQVKS